LVIVVVAHGGYLAPVRERMGGTQTPCQRGKTMIDNAADLGLRPLGTLTIRELVLELSNIEELVLGQASPEQNTYSTRFITQREQLVISELRDRAAHLRPIEPIEDDDAGRRGAPSRAGEKARAWES
jgi:hypothetical protein